MTSRDDVAMELRRVCKSYRGHGGLRELLPGRKPAGEIWALNGISLELRRGRVLGLAGESGSGKSTLANILVGLEKPTSGSVLFGERDLSEIMGAAKREFHRSVQMVFQDPYASLNPRFTVRRTVEEPLIIHGYPAGERLQRVIDTLEEAELRPGVAFLDKFPHELSGGQRQRVAIARAIVLGPTILVADEPVSMLDVSVRAGVLRLLRKLTSDMQMSLLFITHDLSLIGQVCDELMILYRGRVAEYGAGKQVVDSPVHPYTRQLMEAVPVPDPDHVPTELPAQLFTQDASAPSSLGCGFAPRCIFARDICRQAIPELRKVGSLQQAACHRADELPRHD